MATFTEKELNQTLGVRFIGCTFSLILAGAVFIQAFNYFDRWGGRGGDALWIQVMVGIVIAGILGQSICIFQAIYEVHVLQFGNPAMLSGLPLGLAIVPFWSGLINSVVQSYFARRCWLLIRTPVWFPPIVAMLILYVLVGGIYSGVLAVQVAMLVNDNNQLSLHAGLIPPIYTAWLFTCVTVDGLLCGIMVGTLYTARRKTAYRDTASLIVRIMVLTMETFALTSLLSIATAILYLSPGGESNFAITYEPLGKVYASSLLVHLNTRSVPGSADTSHVPKFHDDAHELRSRNAAVTRHGPTSKMGSQRSFEASEADSIPRRLNVEVNRVVLSTVDQDAMARQDSKRLGGGQYDGHRDSSVGPFASRESPI